MKDSLNNDNQLQKQELADVDASGGFSYNKYYNRQEGSNWSSENQSEYFSLTEKERQILRDKGCSFSLCPESGEIESVIDDHKVKLSPDQIGNLLYGKA